MNQDEQKLLRQALAETFPQKGAEELEEMFQTLIKTGGTAFYVKLADNKILHVGVVLSSNQVCYYQTGGDTMLSDG